MNTLSQILAGKPQEVISVRPSDSVLVALEVLASYNIGAVPVISAQGVVGIFSERDYARKVALKGLTSAATEVSEVMSSPVVSVNISDTVLDCMNLMTDRRIRHLPVLDKGQLVGIVSIGDLVRAIIEDQQFQIQQLESYIANA
jgi:CBS domain-containing protein